MPRGGWNRGLKKETDERVRKNSESISNAKTGIKLTVAHKESLRIAKLGKIPPCTFTRRSYEGKGNPFFGKRHRDEAKRMMSEKRKTKVGWHHNPNTLIKLSESKKGPKNPQWKGGYSFYRGALWRMIRRIVLERDGNACRTCGKQNQRLAIHHIVPFMISKNNDVKNLITLCPRCHKMADLGKIKIEEVYHGESNSELYRRLCLSRKDIGEPRIDAENNRGEESSLLPLAVEPHEKNVG